MNKQYDIFHDFKREGKTILYPSSCLYHEDFQDVPFDNVILNSNCFRRHREKIGKVYCLDFDNNELLGILKAESIGLDALVIMRDGCAEGGNYECAGGLSFFGRLMPLIKPGFEYFYDHSFVSCRSGLPKAIARLKALPAYLALFDRHSDALGPMHGWQILEGFSVPVTKHLGGIQVTLHHDSIWNHIDRFDAAFVRCIDYRRPLSFELSKAVKHYLKPSGSNKVKPIEHSADPTITPYLEDALRNGYRRIAFTPFADNRYEPILSEIQNWTAEFPKEITFYHLHRKDYGEIYRLFSRP